MEKSDICRRLGKAVKTLGGVIEHYRPSDGEDMGLMKAYADVHQAELFFCKNPIKLKPYNRGDADENRKKNLSALAGGGRNPIKLKAHPKNKKRGRGGYDGGMMSWEIDHTGE